MCVYVWRAGFEAAEYTPTGPNATLIHVFSVIEHLLTLWLPLAIVAVIALLCLIRLVSLMRCAGLQVPHVDQAWKGWIHGAFYPVMADIFALEILYTQLFTVAFHLFDWNIQHHLGLWLKQLDTKIWVYIIKELKFCDDNAMWGNLPGLF